MKSVIESKLKFLIVEDHNKLRSILSSWLHKLYPEVEINNTSSGEEALKIISDFQPNIVIADIGLPGMTGLELTRRLRGSNPNTSVIILTIYEGIIYEDEAFNSGAKAFVNKISMYDKLPSAIDSIISSIDKIAS